MYLKYLIPLLIALLVSCDVLYRQRNLKLALAKNDYTATYCSSHLKQFLEAGGYRVEIIPVNSTIEANAMVARGEADLSFVLNHSLFMPQSLGLESDNLRTIVPIFQPAMYFFSSDTTLEETSFAGKKISVEHMQDEAYLNLKEAFELGKLDYLEFTNSWDGDYFHFWGNYQGKRAENALNRNWRAVSLDEKFKKFLLGHYPSLEEFTLPAFPGDPDSRPLHTLASQALLICNSALSERTVYELAGYIFKQKLELMTYDRIMYNSIKENFDQSSLLYPLHRGSDSYLRRDQPSFLERYSDAIALVITMAALLYGGLQTLRNLLANRKKDRIQQYFIDFLSIRESEHLGSAEKSRRLNSLLHKMLKQMTENKLDKNDFHIFSRLIQQELTLIKLEVMD